MSTLLAISVLLPWVAAGPFALLDGRRRAIGVASAAVVVVSLAAMAVVAGAVFTGDEVQLVAGGWPEGVGIVLRADALGVVFALVSLLVILAALSSEVAAGVERPRFPALVLFLAAGLNGLFMTGDVFNFYVFFELSMASAYVLTAYRAEEREAGPSLIFAVVNLLGSFVFLIGIAGLYSLTGTLEMEAIAARVGEAEPAAVVMIAVTFFVAFGVKLGLFPFHFWLPAVYAAAHPAVAAILSGALANIGAYGLLRFGAGLLEQELRLTATALIVIGATSVLYGSLQAVARRDVGEVLAYSAIGQAGYVLIALGIGGPVGYSAAVIYAVINALNKGMLFLAAGVRGLLVASAFAVGVLSVVGVPPAAGFLSKVAIFRGGVEADSLALVALLLVGGALSFVYMFQLYQHRFWARRPEGAATPGAARGVVAGLAALILVIGLWPEPLVGASELAADALEGPG